MKRSPTFVSNSIDRHDRMRLQALMIAALLVAPAFAQTDSVVPADHSTVHIVFVVPYKRPIGADC